MTWAIRRLVAKLAQKGTKIDPHDLLNQMSVDDLVHFLKELI